jgi:predicted transcriptional regulator of viral defense system
MELHPYAAISHHSALVFHQLTDQFPIGIHVSLPTDRSRVLPVGTKESDSFPGLSAFRGRVADHIEDVPIYWHHLDKFFGYSEYLSKGYPVRVMTIEKTLIDGLAAPEWCGGLSNVLQAWVNAKDALSLKTVIKFTDRQDVGVLRQRVGYVLEELGFSDSQLEDWTAKAKRGGSSKLLGSAPFAPTFSERWKLSLNAPVSLLHEDRS